MLPHAATTRCFFDDLLPESWDSARVTATAELVRLSTSMLRETRF